MDRARLSPPPDPLRRPLQGEPSGAPDSPVSPETLGEPDTHPPCALAPIPEPLINGPLRCASSNAIASDSASDSASARADAQAPAAPEPRSPDGSRGRVIVFAAFMVNLIAGGITFSFGMFLPHFIEYFGEGKRKAVWITVIFMAMPLLSGPIASFLTDRYGCRRATICGSILTAMGFVISAFVYSMETMFFTFGIMAGFGLSLCYVAAVVIVAYYFDKKRSLATGFSSCGSGIGTYTFAPLTIDWLDKYGWRVTTVILGAIFLNLAVCGLLFRDLPWTATLNDERAKKRKLRRERKRNNSSRSTVDSLTDSKSNVVGATTAMDAVDIEVVTTSIVPQHSFLVDLPTHMTEGERVSFETFELMSIHDSVPCAQDTHGTRQFNDKAALSARCYAGLWDFWDFYHFLNRAFLVFAVSNFLLYMWYHVPYFYIAESGFNVGLDESQAVELTSIIGILNMIGKIILGWVGDWECVNPTLVYAVCMVFCGLVTLLMPLLTSYLSLAAASGAYGFLIAANYSLTSQILVEQITLQEFTKAYGLLLLMQGLANLIGPELSGWVFDSNGSYYPLFYLAGVFIAISGLILLVSPAYNATLRYNNYRKRKSGQVSE